MHRSQGVRIGVCQALEATKEGTGREGKHGEVPSVWFPQERTGQAGWRWTSLNNCVRFWGLGAVPSCLVPGFGVIATGN